MSVVPEGKFARTRIAGVAAAKVGMSELAHKIKRPFHSLEKHAKDKILLDDKNARVLFNALAQLRGTALKIAQMVGMEQGFLPESYQKELAKSFHQVPSLNRVLVRKVFMAEFDKTPEKLFAQFEAEAFAAASLGQVHKANLDGKDVAVKVQYPGIHVSIKSDLTIIRGVARGLPNTHLILQSLDEIEARLMEEVDYKTEAKNTLWFQENNNTEGVFIPQIYSEFSSHRILTTEFIHGMHLNEWLATEPSQALRNQTAQRLYEFFIHSSQELQCLHADPNPGNYLFHEDGTITVIDFGCVRHLSDTFTNVFSLLLLAYMNDDPDAIFPAYKMIGMKFDNVDLDSLYQETLRPFGQWITLPYKTDSFDFSKHSTYSQQGKDAMQNIHEILSIDVENVAIEFIFHNRTIYGLFQIFERMGATVQLRKYWVD